MDNDPLKQHISNSFDNELEDIRSKVLEMGGMVEKQVSDGLIALLESNPELGNVVATSDYEVNAIEVDIDEQCVQILARRQPAATDLRLVVAILKTITDLERIGDEAEKLGRFAVQLHNKGTESNQYAELRHLGSHVRRMLKESLNAFARMDSRDALATIKLDDQVNNEYDSLSRQLITHMMEDPREIKNALKVAWCARALERIGDHSKNICEYVVYLVEGRDVRHLSIEKARAAAERS